LGTYYEPFLGGASVLLALNPERAIVGDMNGWLMDTYEALRADWEKVACLLDGLPNTKQDYLRIRATDPANLDPYARAALFIYLNKAGFRGLFRVNAKGRFNVPYGAYERRYYDPNNLRCFAERLRAVELRRGDFELILAGVCAEDFVYFDPPYYKAGGYADFNRYTHCRFREGDHIRLAALCRELDERGVRWAVSNSDTPFVRSLFDGYDAQPIASRREINLKSQKRDVFELLIRNYTSVECCGKDAGLLAPCARQLELPVAGV